MRNSTRRLRFLQTSSKAVISTFEGGSLSSDCGAIWLAEADRHLGLISAMAAHIRDSRDARKVVHDVEEMLRQRIYGIGMGYEDCNDHDILRSDAVHKLLAGSVCEGRDLASQPTLSRFENQVDKRDLLRMGKEMARRVIASLPADTVSVTLDIDATVDPTYGDQQYCLFNGHYKTVCYCPLCLHLTDDRGNQYLLGELLRSGTAALRGSRFMLREAIRLLRERFPQITITVRADAGFGGDALFKCCEFLDVGYVIRFTSNVALKSLTEDFAEEALEQHRRHQEQFSEAHRETHHYGELLWKAKKWCSPRRIIVKTVVKSPTEITRYFAVVKVAEKTAEELFHFYHLRGEQENRIKEIKCDLQSGRTSCHRFEANQFRVLMHCAANMIWNHLQRTLRNIAPGTRFAQAQISTLQRDLIKVGGRLVERCKHVWMHLSSSYTHSALWSKLHASYASGFG